MIPNGGMAAEYMMKCLRRPAVRGGGPDDDGECGFLDISASTPGQ